MSTSPLDDYAALLAQAERLHGHVCRGIELGVRMAMAGLSRLGIRDPRGADRKRFVVFVETDRCATDAIMAVTGVSPGKRSLKILDFGKLAATFVDVASGRGVRLAARPWRDGEPERAISRQADDELFTIAEVVVALAPEDLPGKPVRRAVCDACGEHVLDGREVARGGRTLCRPCATGARYWSPAPPRAPR